MALVLVFAQTPNASAVTIIADFIGGSPPPNAAGAGNLIDIFDSAARRWESAYSDSFAIRLHFGWAPLGSAGTHTLIEQGGTPNREMVGLILFDNSGAVCFYMDPSPDSNEEYRRLTKEYQDLGGGLVNVAQVFSNPAGDAAGHTDLLTVALHELGHALGMCNANLTYIEGSRLGAIVVAGDHPFAGTVIPLAFNNAGVTSHIDPTRVIYGSVMAGICSDERRIPSALDILANAQISGFEISNLDLRQLPEPDPSYYGRIGPTGAIPRSDRK
jgi:hypothetical protein